MRHSVPFLCATLLGTLDIHAQPTMAWQQHYGGSAPDQAYSIVPTADGGFAVLANSLSTDGDIACSHGQSDMWVLKLDSFGELEWQRCLGGSGAETSGELAQTSDGGFILVGSSSSSDGDVSENLGGSDIWLVRLSASGDLLWERNYGGGAGDMGVQVAVLSDGSFVVMGFTFSQDGDASDNHGASDFWLGHVAEGGELLRSRCYGGTRFDHVRVMHLASDGTVVFGGVTSSNDGDVSGNPAEENQAWVVYLDNEWEITWQSVIGGSGDDQTYGLLLLEDNTVIAAVISDSQNADITDPWGGNDFWIVKLGNTGEIVQQRSFGGSGSDNPRSLRTFDGGQSFYMAGSTSSNNGMVTGQHGGPSDAWLLHLDPDLDLLWQRALGGSGADGANSLCIASDGGIVVGGLTSSSDGDATGTNGSTDVWVVKLEPEDVGVQEAGFTIGLDLFPNPATDQLSITWESDARSITVHDAQGRLVANVDRLPAGQRQQQLNVEAWADGLYTVQLNGTGKRQVQRFAKH